MMEEQKDKLCGEELRIPRACHKIRNIVEIIIYELWKFREERSPSSMSLDPDGSFIHINLDYKNIFCLIIITFHNVIIVESRVKFCAENFSCLFHIHDEWLYTFENLWQNYLCRISCGFTSKLLRIFIVSLMTLVLREND